MVDYDVVIIGAGPGGMSAAVYASRSGLKTLMLDRDAPGGKLMKTAEVENYLGFKHITGPDLAVSMFEHSTAFGAIYDYGNVMDIIDEGKIKKVVTDQATYSTYAVIIATGTKERKVGVPGEDDFYGKGISYCAVCDGALYKGKDMVVIGGGNSALEESVYLANFARKIYIIHRRNEFRAEEHIIERVKNEPKIELVLKYIPVSFNGTNSIESITIEHVDTHERRTISTAVIFPFIGLDPESRFATRLGVTNEAGYIPVTPNMETKIPGIYAIGDITDKGLRQIITASGDGAIAANQVNRYIDHLINSK